MRATEVLAEQTAERYEELRRVCEGSTDTSMQMLEHGHALLSKDLADLTDADLERPVLTNWGDEWPAWRIFWTMIHHDAHHGAEIALLRDLHRKEADRP